MTNDIEEMFLSKDEFNRKVELLASEDGSYIDALVEICTDVDVEIEDAVKLLSKSLKQKIKQEATYFNLLKDRYKVQDLSEFLRGA